MAQNDQVPLLFIWIDLLFIDFLSLNIDEGCSWLLSDVKYWDNQIYAFCPALSEFRLI